MIEFWRLTWPDSACIFQINFPVSYLKIGFVHISKYLVRYGIQSFDERNIQSGKKPVLCMLGLLFTIIKERERSDQENANHVKIALVNKHN